MTLWQWAVIMWQELRWLWITGIIIWAIVILDYMLRTFGKIGKEWAKTRKQWLRDNPPNHQDFYICHYCRTWVHASAITLDHKDSRSRRPDLRYTAENLVPACYRCNKKKGSRSTAEFLHA